MNRRNFVQTIIGTITGLLLPAKLLAKKEPVEFGGQLTADRWIISYKQQVQHTATGYLAGEPHLTIKFDKLTIADCALTDITTIPLIIENTLMPGVRDLSIGMEHFCDACNSKADWDCQGVKTFAEFVAAAMVASKTVLGANLAAALSRDKFGAKVVKEYYMNQVVQMLSCNRRHDYVSLKHEIALR